MLKHTPPIIVLAGTKKSMAPEGRFRG